MVRRYIVPAEVQLVRLPTGLFATTPLGATGFTGGSVGILEEIVVAAAAYGTEEAIVAAFEEDYEGEAIRRCLTLLTRRHVLACEEDDESGARAPSGAGSPEAGAPAEVVPAKGSPGEGRRPRMLVLGAGRLADEISSLCREGGVEVVCQPLGCTPAMRVLHEQAETAHVFPPVPAHPGRPRDAEEDDAQPLKQAMERADLTVLCLDDVLMAHLYEIRDLGVELGRPILPVVARAEDVQVGPLLVPQTAHSLESLMVQPGAAGKGVGREALSLFTAPPSRPLSSGARASLAGLLARAARDPWGLLAWSRHWVGETTRREPIAFDSLTVDPHARGASGHLPTYLNSDIFADERRLGQIREQLSSGRLVAIQNAFDPEFAEAVHLHLDQPTPWETSISYEYLQFIYRKIEGASLPLPLRSLWTALLGTRSREWMEALCGRPCDGDVDLLAFWYMPGGYATPHSDGGSGRSIALVWHLTKDWDDRWGGEFIWHPSGTVFRPSFNSLFMFQVAANQSVHSIAPISPVARGPRRAAVMWYGTHRPHDWNSSRGTSKQALIPYSSQRPVERTTTVVSIPRPGRRPRS
ncbi:2OG-Fe(II) oxygenase family protein [Paraliomyxa miuraensis]|uniref:2OG-Fe(II) oxygenase family protein n=1 Tax=Paraliomyxa miuraensis TaxID=376150 RepID=UPI00224F14FE|nr:2OG-Fe(II) oxygenase family protein [Paraliomyxa miuraensis]MCX4240529.1 2OG-Fe(II) oxygenase [Paraliomyxa miuraensis]